MNSNKKDSGYQFFHRPSDGNYSSIHIWSIDTNETLCLTPQHLFTEDYILTATPPEYGHICSMCQRIVTDKATQNTKTKKRKGPKMAIPRPEEEEYLKRWKGAKNLHPTFWEKMDNDPAYERTVKRKFGDTPIYYDYDPNSYIPPKKY